MLLGLLKGKFLQLVSAKPLFVMCGIVKRKVFKIYFRLRMIKEDMRLR